MPMTGVSPSSLAQDSDDDEHEARSGVKDRLVRDSGTGRYFDGMWNRTVQAFQSDGANGPAMVPPSSREEPLMPLYGVEYQQYLSTE